MRIVCELERARQRSAVLHQVLLASLVLAPSGWSSAAAWGAEGPLRAVRAESSGGSLVLLIKPTGTTEDLHALALVASFGGIEELEKAQGESFAAAYKRACGFGRPEDTRELLEKMNPGLGDGTGAERFRVPTCPIVRDAEIVVNPEDTLEAVLTDTMGYGGPRTIERIRELNPGLPASPKEIRPGTRLRVPWVMRPLVLATEPADEPEAQRKASAISDAVLRPGVVEAFADGRAFFAAKGGAGRESLSEDGSFTLQVATVERDLPHMLLENSAGGRWGLEPSAEAELEHLLVRYEAAGRVARQAMIAVADTGIEESEVRLPLKRTGMECVVDGVDSDEDTCVDDCVGCNARTLTGSPWAEPEYGNREHGTFIAGLVAGSSSEDGLRQVLSRLLTVRPISVVHRAGGGPWIIDFGSLTNAIEYSRLERADVLNISLATQKDWPTLRAILRGQDLPIIVAAAGNAGRSLDANPAFPACYRSSVPDRLISVGGMSRENAPMDSSNFGEACVDIFAPGEDVESIGLGGSRIRGTGTSASAAIVTLAAGLLRALDVPASKVKCRLVASGTHERGLLGLAASPRRLDLVRAAAVADDAVRLADGSWIYGRVRAPSFVTIGRNDMTFEAVRRLDLGARSSAGFVAEWVHRDPNNVCVERVGVVAPFSLTLELSENGAVRSLQPGEFLSVLKAEF